MNRVILGIGANVGDKYVNCERVLEVISLHIGVLVSTSSVYESEAWGFDSVDNFVNRVVIVDTLLDADALLEVIWDIERLFGKTRASALLESEGYQLRREGYLLGVDAGYSSRAMDIDILYFNSEVICSELLDVPHKFIAVRDFVLIPLCEVAPDFVHPVSGVSSLEMLALLDSSVSSDDVVCDVVCAGEREM